LVKKWLLLFTSDHRLFFLSHEDASVHDDKKKPDDMEYPFEDKTFVLSLKKQYSVSNPEQLMLSALGLLTTVKLYNGVNTATSYA